MDDSRESQDPSPALRLLKAARGGDREALDALFARYIIPWVRRTVYRYAEVRLRASIEEEDIVQESLLGVFRGLKRLPDVSEVNFRKWVSAVVQHAIRDALPPSYRVIRARKVSSLGGGCLAFSEASSS